MPLINQPILPYTRFIQPRPSSLPTTLTHIVDTLWKPGLTAAPPKASGTLDIWWPTFQAFDGHVVQSGKVSVSIVNGILDIYLEPNDTATPMGSYYVVQYSLNGGLDLLEHWLVRTETGPVGLSAVRTIPAIATCPVCGAG